GSASTSITVTGSLPSAPLATRLPDPQLTAEESLIDLQSGGAFWKVRVRVDDVSSSGAASFERIVLGYRGHEIDAAEITRGSGPGMALEAIFRRDDLRGLFAGLSAGRQPV